MKRRDFLVSSVIGSVAASAAHVPIVAREPEQSRAATSSTRKILIAGGGFNTAFIRYMAALTGNARPRLC